MVWGCVDGARFDGDFDGYAHFYRTKGQKQRSFKVRLESICDNKKTQKLSNLSQIKMFVLVRRFGVFFGEEKSKEQVCILSICDMLIIILSSVLCRYPFLTGGVDEMDLRFLARIQR